MADAILSTRTLFKGWFDLVMLRIRLDGEELDRAIVEHPIGSAVLAYDPERRVALVIGETRAAVLHLGEPQLVEAIAGVAEEEDFAETARREAMEEGGVRLAEVELVGRVWMTPSSSTERVHLFLAAYSQTDRVTAGGGLAAENEHLLVREVPLAELWQHAAAGTMTDAKTFMLLQALRLRHPELFEG